MSAKSIAVIPARYGSMRFPGKVLALLGGKPIVQHVWERAICSKADEVLVAVDDQRVFDAVCAFGGNVVMTSPNHPSGSDRIWEAAKDLDADLIVNLQGDEPLTPPEVVNDLIDAMEENEEEAEQLMMAFSKQMESQIKTMLQSSGGYSGTLKTQISNIESQISSIDDYLEKYQDRLDRMETSLRSKYSAAEDRIAKLSQQASSISGILSQLGGGNANSSSSGS